MKQKKEQLLSLPIVRFIIQTGEQMNERKLSAHAGQTAFFIMLSFFPFLLFLFAILRLTPLTEQSFILPLLEIIPESFHEFIKALIHDIYSASSVHVLSLTIISAVWLSSKAFLSLVQGLNSIYCQKESRNFVMLRLFAALYSIIFALLIIATLTLLVFGNWIHDHIEQRFPLIASITKHLINMRMIIAFLILFAAFLLLYRVLPNCKWKLRFHAPGAFLATFGWLAFSFLYSYYVDNFSNYSSFYGTMTTIALLMVWLYACMYILFLGGLLNEYLKQNPLCILKRKN